ncbi:hypothetical protein M758_9G024200 [Ceratodon purpureus]|nr:hypothetical protein M758_9G024200 [Ceratodon purpureus]
MGWSLNRRGDSFALFLTFFTTHRLSFAFSLQSIPVSIVPKNKQINGENHLLSVPLKSEEMQ